MNNNNHQNYVNAPEAIYLGYVEDIESGERSAVVKILQFDNPIVVFCPDLTLMDVGDVAYSKDHPEQVGKHMSTLSFIGSSSIAPQLEVGALVSVYFRTGWFPVMRVGGDVPRNKGIFFSKSSTRFGDDVRLHPLSLEGMEHIPRGCITMTGEIVSSDDRDLVIDASVPVLIPNNLVGGQGEKLKIGDWIEGGIGQIYFLEIIKIQPRKLDGRDLVKILMDVHKLSEPSAVQAIRLYRENVMVTYEDQPSFEEEALAIFKWYIQPRK